MLTLSRYWFLSHLLCFFSLTFWFFNSFVFIFLLIFVTFVNFHFFHTPPGFITFYRLPFLKLSHFISRIVIFSWCCHIFNAIFVIYFNISSAFSFFTIFTHICLLRYLLYFLPLISRIRYPLYYLLDLWFLSFVECDKLEIKKVAVNSQLQFIIRLPPNYDFSTEYNPRSWYAYETRRKSFVNEIL